MSVRVGEDGRRFVQVEVEVPGSPEDVWKAIATGPGISSWFVPAKVDERVGGAVNLCFGPGMDVVGTITEWNPPRRFVADSPGMGEGAPTVADEWTVEAKSGGSCVVRVVHRWFADTDEWDGQYEAVENGWVTFFRILKLGLTHFAGQPSTSFEAMAMASGTPDNVWASLTSLLGIVGATDGQGVASKEGAPKFSGVFEGATSEGALIRVNEPGAGICNLFTMGMGEQVYVSVRFYLFGDGADAAATKAEPEWANWFAELFPAEGE